MFILPVTAWQSYALPSWRQGQQLAGVSAKPGTSALSGEVRREMAEASSPTVGNPQQQAGSEQQASHQDTASRQQHARSDTAGYFHTLNPLGSVIDICV